MFANVKYDEPPKIDESEVERIVYGHLSQLEEKKEKVIELLKKNKRFSMDELYAGNMNVYDDIPIFQEPRSFEGCKELWEEITERLSKCTGLRVYGEPEFYYDIDKAGHIGLVNLVFMKK
jgi:hypothetical protein